MPGSKQITIASAGRAAAVATFFAAHTFLAAHTAGAQTVTQATAPALFVAPQIEPVTAVAAPPATPAPTPAVALHAARPALPDPNRSMAGSAAALAGPSPSILCTAPVQDSRLDRPLPRTMRRLASGKPLTIVAIGSSSTAGAGASSPDASYPSRLAVELNRGFPGHGITVLNRGINGEETEQMMARFADDVVAAHPQLVLWQVGTNSVLRDRPLDRHAVELHRGIEQLKAVDADVVLIDPQFSPAVIAKPEVDGMVEQIALAAKEENVDLFHRFAVMRDWAEDQHLGFDTFVAPDHLHMNDWGYACWAKLMSAAIAEAATRPVASAAARPARGATSP